MQKTDGFFHADIESHIQSLAQSSQPLTIADMACGNGVWSTSAARRYPTSSVVGFDISLDQFPPHTMRMKNVDFKILNLFVDEVPSELIGQFDIVHVRLLRGSVPGINPERMKQAFENIQTVLKPTDFMQWEELVYPYFNEHDPRSADPLLPLNGEHSTECWKHFDQAFGGLPGLWKYYDCEVSMREAGFSKAEASKFLKRPELLPFESPYVHWVLHTVADEARERLTGDRLKAFDRGEAELMEVTAKGHLLGYEMVRYVGYKTHS